MANYSYPLSTLSRDDYFDPNIKQAHRVGDPFYNDFIQEQQKAQDARERTLRNKNAAAAELAARSGPPQTQTQTQTQGFGTGRPAPQQAPIESPASGGFTPSADGTYPSNFRYPPAASDNPESFNNRYTPPGINPSGRQASFDPYGDYGQTHSIDRLNGAPRKYETARQNGYYGGAWGVRQQPPGIGGLFEKTRRESDRREMTPSQRRMLDAAPQMREPTPQRRVPAPDTRTQEERDYDLSERRAKNAENEDKWIAKTGMTWAESNRLVRQNEAERISRRNDNIAIFRGNRSGNTSSPYYTDAIKRKTARDAQDTPEGAAKLAENDYRNSLPREAVQPDGNTRPYNKAELSEFDRLAELEREYARRNYRPGQNPNGQIYLPSDPRHSQYRFRRGRPNVYRPGIVESGTDMFPTPNNPYPKPSLGMPGAPFSLP